MKRTVLILTLILALSMPVLLYVSPGLYGRIFTGGFVALVIGVPSILIVWGLRQTIDHRLKRILGATGLNALVYPLVYYLLHMLLGDELSRRLPILHVDMTTAYLVRLLLAGAVVGFITVILIELIWGHPMRKQRS